MDRADAEVFLPRSPDHLGDYASAFDVGRRLAQQGGAQPAVQPIAADPREAIEAMNPRQKAMAARQAARVIGVLRAIQAATPDLAERLRMARHVAARNPRLGVDPSRIALVDVSDAGIAGHMAEAMRLKRRIEARDAMTPLGRLGMAAGGPAIDTSVEAIHQILADPGATLAQQRAAMRRLARILAGRPLPARPPGGRGVGRPAPTVSDAASRANAHDLQTRRCE
jgi:hypothetical protein